MGKYDELLNKIFEDAEERMWQLSSGHDQYFTNYAFIRSATKDHQDDYVRLLSDVLKTTSGNRVFGTAHSRIGERLGEMAKQFGYAQDKNPKDIKDYNIWGETVIPIVYRRTNRMNTPEQQ